jgi:hypothetical protein
MLIARILSAENLIIPLVDPCSTRRRRRSRR